MTCSIKSDSFKRYPYPSLTLPLVYVSVMSKLEGPRLASCHIDTRFIMRIKKRVEVIDRIFIDITIKFE